MEGWPSPVLLGVIVFAVFVGILLLSRLIRAAQVAKSLKDMTTGDRWSEINGDVYMNGKHGVSFSGLNEWISHPVPQDFANEGGFLILEAPDRTARLTFASGPLPHLVAFDDRRKFLNAWEDRARAQLEAQHSDDKSGAIKRMQLSNLDGETEVLRLQFKRPEASRGGVWALHQGDEYVITYYISASSAFRLENLLSNWKWFIRLRADETGLRQRQW